MNDLVDTRSVEFDPLIVCVTDFGEGENIMTTLFRLQRELPSGGRESL